MAGESFLVREDESSTRTVFEKFTAGLVVRRARFAIEVSSDETIKQAVVAGLGLALISAHTTAAEVEAGRLSVLDVAGLPIRRQWFLVRRSDKVLGPAAGAFWTFLAEEGAGWLPTLGD